LFKEEQVMTVAYVTFSLNPEWQKVLDQGRSNDEIHPWSVTLSEGHDRQLTKLVRNLTIHGTCFGDEVRLPNGLPIKVVACGESTTHWNGDDLQIHNGSKPLVRAHQGKRILVRLFTPWLKNRNDDLVLPWRILEEESPGEFIEKQARSFYIEGFAFGLRHVFPDPVGPKMHIACYGQVVWDGLRAHIST
jgi:hypothetical protein